MESGSMYKVKQIQVQQLTIKKKKRGAQITGLHTIHQGNNESRLSQLKSSNLDCSPVTNLT